MEENEKPTGEQPSNEFTNFIHRSAGTSGEDDAADDLSGLFEARQYPLTPKQAFKLNEGQQAALDWLVPFCLGKNEWTRALLEGFAGTGKTFTINRVVEAARMKDPQIAFGMTAPTHKAVRQLYKHSEMKDELDFGTIHSFLGLRAVLKPDPKDRKKMIEVFEPDPEQKNKPSRIQDIDVLIIDESSMLSDDLYEYIDDAVRSHRLRVIFMGDPLQIPPVGNGQDPNKTKDAIPFSPTQRQSRKIYFLQLSEIVRQGAGNPIIEYSLNIRQQYLNQSIKSDFRHDENSGVEVIPRDINKLRELFRQYFLTDRFQNDPDYMKVVAWRNDTVNYFNREIRLILNHADTLPKIIIGDKLVLDKPYFVDKTMLPNNEEMDVLGVDVFNYNLHYFTIERGNAFKQVNEGGDIFAAGPQTDEKHFHHAMKVYKCHSRAMDGREYDILIIHEDSEQSFEQIQKNLAENAKKCEFYDSKKMWKQFYDMQKKFAWTKYNYCLTAHKSQGSTYEYAISMEWDIDEARKIVGIEEANRIRYVAATRARNKLYIVK